MMQDPTAAKTAKEDAARVQAELALEGFERILAVHREFLVKIPVLYPGATGRTMASAGEKYIQDLRRKMPIRMPQTTSQNRK